MNSGLKYGWIFLLLAMAGDLLISLALPLFYKGYSVAKMSISALGNPKSPVRIPFNIWMILEGLLFLLALPSIKKYFGPVSPGLSSALLVIIALFAVGACIFTSIFSVNESKEIQTLSSKIHVAASAISFMAFVFVPLLVAILFFKGRDNGAGVFSVISFVVGLAFFVLFVMSDKSEFSKTIISCEGLWQRLNLLFMYLPLAFLAVKMLKNQ